MLQFRFNSKLDSGGFNLRALLKAQITYEHLSGFRSLYVHLMAVVALPVWLQAIWPNLLPPETRFLVLALWGVLFSLASCATIMEFLARRELNRRLAANNRGFEVTDPGRLS